MDSILSKRQIPQEERKKERKKEREEELGF